MSIYYQDSLVTLYHADAKDIVPTLPDTSIDFIFTDPPYGHNNNNNGDLIHNREKALGQKPKVQAEARPIANDGAEANDLVQWFFGEANRLLRHGGCCCCCGGGGGPDPQFARWSLWLDAAIGFKHMVIWDKGGLGMGWHYRRNYETVLIGEKKGGKCKWYGDNKVANVFRFPKISPRATDHPTPKPVELPSHFIQLHSEQGDTILDPFAGGGSTVVAARNLGRKIIAVELEEKWCELIVRRLQQDCLALEVAGAA